MKERIMLGRVLVGVVAMSLLAMAPIVLTGCEGCGKEEEQAAPAKEAKPGPVPEAKPAPPPPPPVAAADAPVTLEVLSLTPDSAMITLALPPIAGALDKGVAVAKLILGEDAGVDEEVAKSIAQMAGDAGVPGASSIDELAQAKGFSADKPLALFVDPTRTAQSVEAAGGGASLEDVSVEDLTIPAAVLVLPVADAAKAEQTLKEVVGLLGGYVDAGKVEAVDTGGVSIQCYDADKLAYCVAGDKLLVGTSLAMLKEAIARTSNPAVVRYGSAECPATAPDEIAMLLRMDKMAPLLKDLLPLLAELNPQAGAYVKYYESMLAACTGDDPIVTTLALTDEKLELMSRTDLVKHAALAALQGDAKPLRLAPLLPKGTLVVLSLRLNDETKVQLKQSMQGSMAQFAGNAELADVLAQVEEVLDVLDDELTIGITGMETGLPALFIMAGLKDVDKVRSMIEDLATISPGETYGDVEVEQLAVPIPLPISLAFVDKTLVVSNDTEKLKSAIDLFKEGTPSGLLASLDPPIDPAAPRYFLLSLDTDVVSKVVVPLSGFAGGLPPDVQKQLAQVTKVVSRICVNSEVAGNWHEESLTVYMQ